jgi:GNAT superfamily N-acetyltransferase
MSPDSPSTPGFRLRALGDDDRAAYGELVHAAFNAWYWRHGWGRDYFPCTPADAAIFYDIYNDLTPGRSIAAVAAATGRLLGACFFHPRERHVSLGIMSVHPSYGGRGVGRALVNAIVDFTDQGGYAALRLVSSAMNMDSFSLYNRSGLVPVQAYHDMVIGVPPGGHTARHPARDRVRPATLADVSAMGALETEVSGIRRDLDYPYAIANPRDCLHADVCESVEGGLEGWMVGVRHPALNMLGPCVARTEEAAAALILAGLERYRGKAVLLLVPMDKRNLVQTLYGWGARNVETHLFQVRGEYQPFLGVSLPSFLPETG